MLQHQLQLVVWNVTPTLVEKPIALDELLAEECAAGAANVGGTARFLFSSHEG
jgi:hypothetical protein